MRATPSDTETPLTLIDNRARAPEKSELLFGSLNPEADLSIVIPVYGLGSYFDETLKSIVSSQPCSLKIQIVISDNKPYKGGKNPFLGFLGKQEFPKSFSIAYFHVNKDLGILNNFNRSIDLAPTKYVAMLHDDDLILPDFLKRLETILPWIKKHPKTGMIHGHFEPFTDKVPNLPNRKTGLIPITKASVTSLGATGTGVPSCGFFVNKDIFFACGGFNETYKASGDAFPAAIMLQEGYKVYEFHHFTGLYRIANNGSLRPEICRRFIQEDYAFYEAWKKHGSPTRKLYMGILERFFYSFNIDGKLGLFSKKNPEITIESLDFLHRYKHYGKLHPSRILFLLFKKTSRAIRTLTRVRF